MLPGIPGQLGVPGDQLKPNDFGLFDMLGNVAEWCHDPVGSHTLGPDVEHEGDVIGGRNRVFRGGSLSAQSRDVRSAYRYGILPVSSRVDVGFRPVRTFP
jgi:formylglycine-generating enzyme required for sulfatase activity